MNIYIIMATNESRRSFFSSPISKPSTDAFTFGKSNVPPEFSGPLNKSSTGAFTFGKSNVPPEFSSPLNKPSTGAFTFGNSSFDFSGPPSKPSVGAFTFGDSELSGCSFDFSGPSSKPSTGAFKLKKSSEHCDYKIGQYNGDDSFDFDPMIDENTHVSLKSSLSDSEYQKMINSNVCEGEFVKSDYFKEVFSAKIQVPDGLSWNAPGRTQTSYNIETKLRCYKDGLVYGELETSDWENHVHLIRINNRNYFTGIEKIYLVHNNVKKNLEKFKHEFLDCIEGEEYNICAGYVDNIDTYIVNCRKISQELYKLAQTYKNLEEKISDDERLNMNVRIYNLEKDLVKKLKIMKLMIESHDNMRILLSK